jgi:hypothetical protein
VFNRWLGIVFFALMASANTALFVRDVLPRWYAGDAPRPQVTSLKPGEVRWVQTGIYRADGRYVGRSWTRLHRGPVVATHEVFTFLNPVPLPTRGETPRLHIQMKLTYHKSLDVVEDLRVHVFGLPFVVELEGGQVSTEFPIVWTFGSQRGQFILDGAASRSLADRLRPFDRLPDLEVGQTWRMELLDPLTGMVPGLRESGVSLEPVYVRVASREPIEWEGRTHDAFRVEAPGAVAWVSEDGRVLKQEIDLPLIGRVVILDETFNEKLYKDTDLLFREHIDIPEMPQRGPDPLEWTSG